MRRATPIVLDEPQRIKLEGLKRGRRVPVRLAERAGIVLHAADGMEDQQIAALMGITRQEGRTLAKTVRGHGSVRHREGCPPAGAQAVD